MTELATHPSQPLLAARGSSRRIVAGGLEIPFVRSWIAVAFFVTLANHRQAWIQLDDGPAHAQARDEITMCLHELDDNSLLFNITHHKIAACWLDDKFEIT